nr:MULTISPECIES: response regulator transcription factor [Massilia]
MLIDDHHLFRQGLKFLLADLEAGIAFAEAATLPCALAHAGEHAPELVLVDLHMPGEDSMGVLTAIRAAFDASMVVVLSSEDDPDVILRAIEAGASGYVPKSSTPQILIAALRLVMAGGIYIPPPALRAFAAPAAPRPPSSRECESLSGRQMEVLLKAVQGKANKVIAREMQLSEGTVKAHLSAAFRTLGVQNRTEAVFAAARMGLQADVRPS